MSLMNRDKDFVDERKLTGRWVGGLRTDKQ
jgi:hypothetical protein